MAETVQSASDYQRYFGKYRAKVLDNVDLLGLGRILPDIAAFPGSQLNWAMPCVPYAGDDVGFYAIPPIGASVWIEFEGGDPNYPIWSGCFWDEGEMPLAPPVPERKVFKTKFITMILNDTPEEGGFTLECIPEAVQTPLKMIFNSQGIEINADPAVITMVPDEGITIRYPPGTVSMTEETIEITLPESTITVTQEAITAGNPPTTMTMSAESIVVDTPDVNITAAVEIEGTVEIEGETNITPSLTVQGDANVTGLLTAEGDANVAGLLTAEGDANVAGLLTAEGDTNVAGALTIEGGGEVDGFPII